MEDFGNAPDLGRRRLIVGASAAAGLAVVRGLGVRGLATAPVSYEQTLRELAASFTPGQRARIVLPADDPSRQVSNTIAILERPHLGTLLSPSQRALVERLSRAMLSERGQEAFAGTFAVEGRLDGCVFLIYGEPETGRAQAVISGGHILLRGGGESPEGNAFGGGVAYGHQVGNGRWKIPGNAFAYHGDAANRLYARLSAAERAQAIVPAPPHELVLQPQPHGAAFRGVRVGALGEAAREEAGRLLETVFSAYPDADRARVFSYIEGNGGPGALHVAYYASHGFYEDMTAYASLDEADRARRGDPYWQVWRIEGPGTIVHFKGHPHVHAYIQVVRDPAKANIGAALARADAAVEGEPLRRLLEASLRRATGERLAYYGAEAPGRFCAGEITTGLACALDPYRNPVVVATIEGRAMGPDLAARLAAQGVTIVPTQRYRVATALYFTAIFDPDAFGRPESVEESRQLLREAIVAELRADGLRAARG
jgi:uncharacterized protein DUF3500